MKTTLCFRLILILVLLCAGYANATNVSGIIGADTTWTLANSPYIVVGNILVDSGVTLTIEPGVTVKFNQDLYLYVDGTLIAPGTESNMITFTSNQITPAKGDWKYIKFRDSAVDATFDGRGNYVSGCILEYCTLEYGGSGSNERGIIWCDNSKPFISYSTVRQSQRSGICFYQSGSARVRNCTLDNNSYAGIYFEYSPNGSVDNCISNNNHSGVYFQHFSNNGNVSGCTFSDNGGYGIFFGSVSDYSSVSNSTVTSNGLGILFNNTSNCTVNNCTLSNNSNWGVKIENNSNNNSVSVCTLNNNSTGLDFGNSSSGSVSNCTIRNNNVHGIYFSDSSGGNVSSSFVIENHDVGIYCYGNSSNLIVQNCDLHSNTNYDVKLNSNPNDVTATNIWWGTMDTDVIDAHIWDYYDDFDLGKVIYTIRDAPLAVTLASVTATTTPNSVTIKWRTESEVNNVGFSIYRSESNGNYTKISFVSGAGNSAMPTDYQFIDKSVEAGKTYFYYIEDIDVAGERKKSKIIKVVVPAKSVMPIPKEFALLQNYPNPFNPETWISFKLAQDTPVTISIYDLKGQLIRTISLGNKNAGIYTTKDRAGYWDGRDSEGSKVSSGMYFYTLQAGEFRATRKMVVVK